MKKILMTLVAVFATMTLFTLSSCSSDDEPGGDSIVGDWASVQIESSGTYMFMERLKFNSNGTFTGVDYGIYGQDLNGNAVISRIEKATFSGTYTAADGILSLTIGVTQQLTYKLSGSVLSLTSSEGTADYDKVDNNINGIFNDVEQLYQAQQN